MGRATIVACTDAGQALAALTQAPTCGSGGGGVVVLLPTDAWKCARGGAAASAAGGGGTPTRALRALQAEAASQWLASRVTPHVLPPTRCGWLPPPATGAAWWCMQTPRARAPRCAAAATNSGGAGCTACVDTEETTPTLRALARCHAARPRDVLSAVRQVLHAVGALQRAFPGFRHNDLKTDNVLLHATPGGVHAYIIDFELAHVHGGGGSGSGCAQQPCAPDVMAAQAGLADAFGVDARLPCDVFDADLLLTDLLLVGSARHPEPAWMPPARRAAARLLPPGLAPERTREGRLTLATQRALAAR